MGSLLFTACALLLTAAPATAEHDARPTVAVDLSVLDRPTFERLEAAGIYQALVLRLVREDVALVDPRARADTVLRFQVDPSSGALRVTAVGAGGERSQSVDIRALERDAVRLEVVHVAVELVRQVQALVPPGPPPEPPAPTRAAPGPLRTYAELTAGGIWNAGDVGFLARLGGLHRLGPLDLGVSLWLHRPLSTPSSFSLTEVGVFAVVGTGERAIGSRLRVSAALDAGALHQSFHYSGPDGSDSGARLDPAVAIHGNAAWRLSPSWRVGLTAGALLSRGRAHEDSSGRLFRTPALRPLLGLTLAFGQEGR